MQRELDIAKKLLKELKEDDMTLCISDIVARVKGITPSECNNFLIGKGMIERRASGYYPTTDYKDSELCITASSLGYDGNYYGYVRYTRKGVDYVLRLLVESGYSLI